MHYLVCFANGIGSFYISRRGVYSNLTGDKQ